MSEISQTLDRIIGMSIDTYYNPYKTFQWPDELPEEQWWMTRELMTIHGTALERQLSERQLMALSKWESIHFYSLNVHGIRELLLEVIKRVHTPGFEEESEFFHHFVGEENEHMWFFATFCLKYGKKIYIDRKIKIPAGEMPADVESLLVFARVLIFEEIVDYFNLRMGRDESLHPIIRQVNAIHHQDESRHIAFGREIVRLLWDGVRGRHPEERQNEIRDYLGRYLQASIQSLYSPAVYSDAGVPEPYKVRTALLADPVRHEADTRTLKRTSDFFSSLGLIQ
ncbi:MAG: diiron oxygenase [Acidobacteriota bacterium]